MSNKGPSRAHDYLSDRERHRRMSAGTPIVEQAELAEPVVAGTHVVLDEVGLERLRQIVEKGYTAEHDDEHTLAEFAAFIEQRTAELRYGQMETTNPLRAHKLLRETAALAVAALEKLIRAAPIPPGDAK